MSENLLEENGPEKEITFLDSLYGIVMSPSQTLRSVAENEKLSWSVITFLAVQFFSVLLGFNLARSADLQYFISKEVALDVVPYLHDVLENFVITSGLIGIFFGVVLWVVFAGLLALLAQFFGGSGNGKRLFIALGFTSIPTIFSSLLDFLIKFAGGSSILTAFIGLGSFIWSFVLNVIAIKVTQNLSTGKSLLVMFLPVIVGLGFIIFLIFTFIFSIAALFQHFPGKLPIT